MVVRLGSCTGDTNVLDSTRESGESISDTTFVDLKENVLEGDSLPISSVESMHSNTRKIRLQKCRCRRYEDGLQDQEGLEETCQFVTPPKHRINPSSKQKAFVVGLSLLLEDELLAE